MMGPREACPRPVELGELQGYVISTGALLCATIIGVYGTALFTVYLVVDD